jgi:hypothetical protein
VLPSNNWRTPESGTVNDCKFLSFSGWNFVAKRWLSRTKQRPTGFDCCCVVLPSTVCLSSMVRSDDVMKMFEVVMDLPKRTKEDEVEILSVCPMGNNVR